MVKSEDEGYDSYFSSLLYQDSADQEQEEPSLETELKEAELGLKIPEVPSYSPELLARLDDEKHLGRESNQQMGELTGSIDDIQKDEAESSEQMGLVLYTFSDKVTPGLIDYSVITFYVSIVFVAGKLIRSYLWGDTPRISIKEVPYPDELLIICEGVVISRMRKDIYREEELYMLLIDLIRSPEILKEITHPLFKTKKE